MYTHRWRTLTLILVAVILLDADRHWEAATLPAVAIAPSTEIIPPHTSPLHSEPEPAPTTADRSSEATPSDEVDVEAEIADMVGMIPTALSSDPQDVEGAVSSVNEIIKAVRKTVGISNNTIWERLTTQEQAAYIRALNSQSQPEDKL